MLYGVNIHLLFPTFSFFDFLLFYGKDKYRKYFSFIACKYSKCFLINISTASLYRRLIYYSTFQIVLIWTVSLICYLKCVFSFSDIINILCLVFNFVLPLQSELSPRHSFIFSSEIKLLILFTNFCCVSCTILTVS